MKEPDYVMSLMSLYGTNMREGKTTFRKWHDKNHNWVRNKSVRYPEVIHNHFKYRHAVDDHNAKRHSPISLEVFWGTKRWPNRVFACLLEITEVNTNLEYHKFSGNKPPLSQ